MGKLRKYTNPAQNGAKAFSRMNSAMVVKIAIVVTVTVGGMNAAVEPIGIYSRRVTGETMTILYSELERLFKSSF
ncbi:hypothetical protein [Shewanella sp. MR-4]|uniref:hypothetical protein n=1 Tax=Shewanella sp. (strain MR-4) TaxID=60480 RepID=UPI00059D42F1|nr:hypothetical protein [Shewanella sp. MR-4]